MTNKQQELPSIAPAPSFPARVWGKLSRIDVSDNIETKGGANFQLSYLSWSWAWAQLMNNFPESVFTISEQEVFPDNTVSVSVIVEVREGEERLNRRMWLPVMDHKNNAIPNPNARNVSDSQMRCLVKCLGLFGLGLDVYAKSDIPVGTIDDVVNDDQLELLEGLFNRLNEDSQAAFLAWLDIDSPDQTPQGKYKTARMNLERKIKSAGAKA